VAVIQINQNGTQIPIYTVSRKAIWKITAPPELKLHQVAFAGCSESAKEEMRAIEKQDKLERRLERREKRVRKRMEGIPLIRNRPRKNRYFAQRACRPSPRRALRPLSGFGVNRRGSRFPRRPGFKGRADNYRAVAGSAPTMGRWSRLGTLLRSGATRRSW
jgi:hypothetical protein